MINKKAEGSYYTPLFIAEYMIEQCKLFMNHREKIEILEPSCGDGVFIKALLKKIEFANLGELILCGVEKDKDELNKAKKYKSDLRINGIKSSFYNQDFLDFSLKRKRKFDIIIGNPPYIQKKYIDAEQTEKIKNITNDVGLNINHVHNIWIAFVAGALKLLKKDGILCFVLPFEMLQVKYAEPITTLLADEFDEIKIATFDERIFPGIEQDVVMLLCIRKSLHKKVTYKLLKSKTLEPINEVISQKNTYFSKWYWYTLNPEENALLESLKSKFDCINKYCVSGTGIVTGQNEYFILRPSEVLKHGLQNYVLPVLKKSSFVKDTINFTNNHFEKLVKADEPCFMLNLNEVDVSEMDSSVREYIMKGEQLSINKNYKCKQRNEWFKIPSIWSSEAYFFKRSHIFPKIILNTMDVYVTDTAYRIKMREDYDIKSLIFCFYNSLTLIDSELNGRRYGGGVLELTPNEFKKVKIPYLYIDESHFIKLSEFFKRGATIDEILDYNDEVILINKFKIGINDVNILKEIRKKIVNNRVN